MRAPVEHYIPDNAGAQRGLFDAPASPLGNRAPIAAVGLDKERAGMSARTVEVYHVACVCGHEFETPAKPVDESGAVVCPSCGLRCRVQWQEPRA